MTDRVKPSVMLANIPSPAQDLELLSFCASTKPAVLQKWLDNLRATQVNQTAMQLYNAIPEIARLTVPYQTRLEMLEIIRTRVQDSIEALQKGFLNQPIIMPEEAQKAVLIAQSMQKSMTDGYVVVISQITQLSKAKKNTMDDLAKAISRAITGIGLMYFRSCQIYTQLPAQFWSTLHCLYQVADFYDVVIEPVEDPILTGTRTLSIEAVYARILMLASARTNQLSQHDIAAAYYAFERWSPLVKLRTASDSSQNNFLVVNLRSDQGPQAKSKIKDPIDHYCLEIDFSQLLSHLGKKPADATHVSPSKIELIPADFPPSVLKHLHEAWGNDATRKNERRKVASAAHVCVGLVDCHYYVTNGRNFGDFVQNFDDSLHHNLPSGVPTSVTPDTKVESEGKASYRVNIQNSSPGGYCLLWQGKIPNKVVAGELVGIKEIGKRSWDLGVIRWVRQLKGASQLGIQILSHNAKPLGIAQTYGMGGHSDYMRGFYLPPERFAHNAPSLLTGAVPFEELDKVKLANSEQQWSAKLENQLFTTKNIQQFTFQSLDKAEPMPKAANSNSGRQVSSWDDI